MTASAAPLSPGVGRAPVRPTPGNTVAVCCPNCRTLVEVPVGPNDLRPCGTRSAYERHRARGERPCEPCTLAARDYYRDKKRRQRADPSFRRVETIKRTAQKRLAQELAGEIVDDIVVERLVRGERVRSTRAEKVAATAVLLARGARCDVVAARLHTSWSTARQLMNAAASGQGECPDAAVNTQGVA